VNAGDGFGLAVHTGVLKTDMPTTGKRYLMGRGKGYLHATASQFRFILFMVLLLISFTFLLRVFQKLAEIVQLPVFLPIALITLLIFIGIVGMLYSHTFVGPMIRIRRELGHLADGDMNISLRLRESDDPMLKDVVATINQLCEKRREARLLILAAASELFQELDRMQEHIRSNADAVAVRKQAEVLRVKQEQLDKVMKAGIKA